MQKIAITKIGSEAHKKVKFIKMENIETGDVCYFKSKNQASKYCNCSPALIFQHLEHPDKYKSIKDKYKCIYEIPKEEDKDLVINIQHARTGRKFDNGYKKKQDVLC